MNVRPKKYLGQHFLIDANVAKNISDALSLNGYHQVLEVGPGTGKLTSLLINKNLDLKVVEIDSESVIYLDENFSNLKNKIIEKDFLKLDFKKIFRGQFAIIGNFPYNISSQILFKIIDNRDLIVESVGMFQQEVAKRICESPGKKSYGILSVLIQAFYKAEYLFNVSKHVFQPPPKVASGVIRLKRKKKIKLNCDEKLFFLIVKTSFQQRRKILRNSLKSFGISLITKEDSIFEKRPEQLNVSDFVELTSIISNDTFSN